MQPSLHRILSAVNMSEFDASIPCTLQIATRDSGTYRKMASVIEQLRARDARLIVMVNEGDPLLTSPGAKGCHFIEVRFRATPPLQCSMHTNIPTSACSCLLIKEPVSVLCVTLTSLISEFCCHRCPRWRSRCSRWSTSCRCSC